MKVVYRTQARILLSVTADELACIKQGLAESGAIGPARLCLDQLDTELDTHPVSDGDELLQAWADGASVQVRAITAFGDPADLGTEEAREFATRILECATAD
jgi:hypothetical protein